MTPICCSPSEEGARWAAEVDANFARMLDPHVPPKGGGVQPPPPYEADADAEAYFARWTSPPTAWQKYYLTDFVTRLKAGSVWSVWDHFVLLGVSDRQAGKLHLMGSSGDLTETGSPTFTPKQGFSGVEATNFLLGSVIPSMANYKKDDASLLIWNMSEISNNAPDVIGSGSNHVLFCSRDSGGRFSARANASTTVTQSVSRNVGLNGFIRRQAADYDLVVDNLLITRTQTSSTNGTATANTRPKVACSPRSIAFFAMGSQLSQAQLNALNDALITLFINLEIIDFSTWNTSFAGTDIDLTGATLTYDEDFDVAPDIAKDDPDDLMNDPPSGHDWYAPARGSYGQSKFQSPDTADIFLHSGSEFTLRIRHDGTQWIGGHIQTVNTDGEGFSHGPGYFEAKIRLPNSEGGAWPAFWLKGINSIQDQESVYAELDIFEGYSSTPTSVHSTWHKWRQTTDPSHTGAGISFAHTTSLFDDTYHLYGMEITETHAIAYFDRKEIGRFALYPEAQAPLFLMLSHALQANPASTASVLDMVVDYVKVWER